MQFDFNKEIDNSIVIVPNEFKSFLRIYKSKNYDLNFKFFSKEDLKKNLFGENSLEIIGYLLNNSNYNYDFIKLFLNYYFSNALINDNFKDLNNLKILLENSNLVKTDSDTFIKLFKNKKIYVFGYSLNDLEIKRILEILKVNNPIYFELDKLPIKKRDCKYIVFSTFEEEIHHCFNLVSSLIEKEKVVLVGEETSKLYFNLFKDSYNLKINNENLTLFDNRDIKFIAKNISNKKLIDLLIESENLDETIKETVKKLDEIFHFDNLKNKEYIFKEITKSINLETKHYNFEVGFTSNFEFNPLKKYILFGATSDFLPKIVTNKEIYSDEEKEKLGLTSVRETNRLNKEIAKLFLTFENVISISTHSCYGKKSLPPSYLFEELNIKEDDIKLLNYDYSKDVSKLFYSQENDYFKRYGKRTNSYLLHEGYFNELDEYSSNYSTIERIIKTPRIYSYSDLSKYFNCAFSYYLTYLLRVNPTFDDFNARLGNYAHEVFEHIYEKGFNAKEKLDQFEEKYNFDKKEKLLLNRFKEDVIAASNLILTRTQDIILTKYYSEQKLKTYLNGEVIIEGKIDSIVETDGKNLFIIDYKSGSFEEATKIKIENSYALQLPIYLYLICDFIKENKKTKNIGGMFYAPISSKAIYKPNDKRYEDSFKLNGRFIDNIEILESFDKSFVENDESLYINKLKLKNNLISRSVNMLSDSEINEINKFTYNAIIEADKRISSNNFTIGLTMKKSTKDQCDYCGYKNICFKYFNNDEEGGEE